MKHTLESLLALASTNEGKQQIRVMVAGLFGWQMIKGERPSSLGHLIAQLDGKTGFVPFYHTSLDAIMPEVRKLNEGEKARFLNELQSVCAVVVSRHFTLARAMLSADPIHHCIAFLLTLQA